jgi:hypothetical protein
MFLLEFLLDMLLGVVSPFRDTDRGTGYWVGVALLIAAVAGTIYYFTRQA